MDRARRRARRMVERAQRAWRPLALQHRAEIPGARRTRGGARARPSGAREPPARQGYQAGGHRRGERPRLASPVYRHAARRAHRRAGDRVRRQRDESLSMASATQPLTAVPKQLLSVSDGVMLICGMVIGAGIFKLPSTVAGNTTSATAFLLAWLLGGAVSLCGALVYAELASRYPETGGEYAFLSRGIGRGAAFVFAWSRMTVIQTGAIAAVAFVFGDYASEIFRLGDKSSAIYAALGVAVLTLLNFAGTVESKTLQKIMQVLLFAGLLFIALGGLMVGAAPGQLARGGKHARKRAASAGRHRGCAGPGCIVHTRRVQRHGGLHRAGVLDVFSAHRPDAFYVPEGRRRPSGIPRSPLPGRAARVLRHVRLHALLARELRALRLGIRRARARRARHHACRHPALLPAQKESMTLTELRYIVAVARERHFGRAAETCFVSQPTLSVAVKKLEEELGVTLFERGSAEVAVTPAGQKIVEQAQRVLEESARIKEIAAAGRDPLAGPLRLGAIYTIGPYLLPKLIPILRRAAPAMQLP